MKRLVLIVILILLVSSQVYAWEEIGSVWLSGGAAYSTCTKGDGTGSGIVGMDNFLPNGVNKAYFFFTVRSASELTLSIIVNKANIARVKITRPNNWLGVCIPFDPELVPAKEFTYSIKVIDSNEQGEMIFKDIGVWSGPNQFEEEKLMKVLIHLHSKHSDGIRTIKECADVAKSFGFDVMVMTDHFDLLFGQAKKKMKNTAKEYIAECKAESNSKFLATPGIELCSTWYRGKMHMTGHFIAFPISSSEIIPELQAYDQQAGVIQKLMCACAVNHMVMGIAHPFLVPEVRNPGHGFAFNFDEYDWHIGGMEFFNNDDVAEEEATLKEYLDRVNEAKANTAYAGNDSHSPAYPTDSERWTRASYAYLKELNQEELVEAYKKGKFWATNNSLQIISANLKPNGKIYLTDQPTFSYRFQTPNFKSHKSLGLKAKIRLYRDGDLVDKLSVKVEHKSGQFAYNYTDKTVDAGYHIYVLVVDHYLVSSPIKVVVTE